MSCIQSTIIVLLLVVIPSLFVTGRSQHTSFSYDPDASNGPSNWGDLPIDNNACSGNSNSPIALNSTNRCDIVEDYVFEAGNCSVKDLQFELLSHVAEAKYPDSSGCIPSAMQIPGISGTFDVIQFHIHALSEHSLDGEFFHAELHIVHKQRDDGMDGLAVIGVFIVSDAEEDNADFDTLLDEWEAEHTKVLDSCLENRRQLRRQLVSSQSRRRNNNDQAATSATFNIYDLIPQGSNFYHYYGSLTTPPCSEIVEWNVAETPLFISAHQYNKLKYIILNYYNSESCEIVSIASPSGSTSRPIQPLNNRIVRRVCSATAITSSSNTYGNARSSGVSAFNVRLIPLLWKVCTTAIIITTLCCTC